MLWPCLVEANVLDSWHIGSEPGPATGDRVRASQAAGRDPGPASQAMLAPDAQGSGPGGLAENNFPQGQAEDMPQDKFPHAEDGPCLWHSSAPTPALLLHGLSSNKTLCFLLLGSFSSCPNIASVAGMLQCHGMEGAGAGCAQLRPGNTFNRAGAHSSMDPTWRCALQKGQEGIFTPCVRPQGEGGGGRSCDHLLHLWL